VPPLPITDPRWDALLDDFRHSGLTHAEFCRLRGVPVHTFRKRLYQDRDAAIPAADPAPQFLPVTVVPDAPARPATAHTPLELILPHGRRIVVAPGFDPRTLRLLLDVLEGPPCSA
jgi:hypothetical protein